MKNLLSGLFYFILAFRLSASVHDNTRYTVKMPAEIPPLRYNLSADGKLFFQTTFLNQVWFRFNESNPATLREGLESENTFDIGLRRTRIQLFGQVTERTFLYFQFGQNNFNSQFNLGSNRKVAAFFHDALCDFRVSNGYQLIFGGGLTIANGLSRFAQPAISSIMTMDVPVFAQSTVDQVDEFSRKLSLYARGQLGPFDYRLVLSDPFPIQSNGQPLTNPSSSQASFSRIGHYKQYQGFFQYQFFEKEQVLTPYMTGTYLGKKKILNLAAGFIYQPNAMWLKNPGLSGADSIRFQDMKLWAAEVFYDAPLNKEKGSALSAYLGYFNYDYGTRYLRYNGIMNPGSGLASTGGSVSGSGAVFGNAYPMFGTGQAMYAQVGWLLPGSRLMPYASCQYARWKRLDDEAMAVYNLGLNYFFNGHQSKMSLDWQNRPVFSEASDGVKNSGRRNSIVLQYQIFL
jgi:hypothetical protein